MYSLAWFDTFAARLPAATSAAELAAIIRLAPPAEYRRLLDVGCGVGRTVAPLAERGYDVFGLDISFDALRQASRAAPSAGFVALDQKHVGRLRWRFDVATVLWNSFGFGDRSDDLLTLTGLSHVLRPGGRLLLDMYHPDWLAAHQLFSVRDDRGATVDRWLHDGKCHHRIRYDDGAADDIQFNVYQPAEIAALLGAAGFTVAATLVWWDPGLEPGPAHARYQIVATRALPG